MKRLQNKIAEGGATLTATMLLCAVVWLLCGLWTYQLWPQLACFAATVYLLVELNNQNALLRVRSRMVSSTFIVLSCIACFLLPHLTGGFVQLCFTAAIVLLFQIYQQPYATGRTFYAFLFIGVASLAFVQTLWYVPVLWLLMGTQLQALSWRAWLASILGVAAPYWFMALWLMIPVTQPENWAIDLSPLANHLSQLTSFHSPLSTFHSPLSAYLTLIFVLVLASTGAIHFWQHSFEDKIRIRLLHGFFTAMTIVTTLFIVAQPQYFDIQMRICLVCASPLIAHLLTFTNSRLSNILFFVILAITIGLTAYNLWSFNTSL